MKNIKIGPKLIVSFLFTAVLSAFIGIYLIEGLRKLSDETAVIYEKGAIPLGLLIETANDMQEMRVQIRNWWIAKTPEGRANAMRIIDEKQSSLMKSIEGQKGLVISEISRRALEDAKVKIDKFVEEAHKYTKSVKDFDERGNPMDGGLPESVLAAGDEMTESVGSVVQIRVNNVKNISEGTLELANYRQNVAIIILAVVLLISVCLGIYLTLAVTSPLGKVMDAISEMEKGNMTTRINMTRKDEFGVLGRALDSLMSRLQTIFKNLQQDSDTLASSAEELSNIGKQVTKNAEDNESNIVSVASASEQASANTNTIAAAVEEMSASINQIATNAGDANKVAQEATEKSREATGAMSKLGSAAKEIGQVTDVIKKIADMTNLLALNATIEAASAGESGKGFAVVAGEIKELANQSAKSADDIARRIEGIQAGTGEAVTVINGVSDIITKMNHSVESISSHVNQQTKASNEISRNTSEAAKGVSIMNQNVAGIARGAKESADGAKQINQSAGELSKLAGNLKGVLSQFRV